VSADWMLDQAVNGLRRQDPGLSAAQPLQGWQRRALWTVLILTGAAALWQPVVTATVFVCVSTAAYVLVVSDRIVMFRRGLICGAIRISDAEARAIPDADLPTYTVLVPAYNEPEIVGELIAALTGLDYPQDKLEVLLLLEADDSATIAAAQRCAASPAITVVLVPAAEPRTKPKACNYGLHFATGELVTIFDAEDVPDPLQLRRVVAAFGRLSDEVACIQARLAFHNRRSNFQTAWFASEYGLWFGYVLPGMMSSHSPIPLGGTSNHVRRPVLDKIGAWDPFNVTEDADLGLRIAATGYRTAVLESTTMEEANSDPINWLRQRSRWYKGYLQTWLVHVRRPRDLFRSLGFRGFMRFNLVLAGTPLIAVLNLFFWFLTVVWFLGHPALIEALFPWYVYFPAVACLVLGNAAVIYMNLVALREDDRADLMGPALLVPFYWVMMSVAAAKGVYQLVRNPSHWEKTHHGLDRARRVGGPQG